MPTRRQKLQQLRKLQERSIQTVVRDTGLRTSVLTLGDRRSSDGLATATDDQGNQVQVRSLGLYSGGGQSLPGIVVGDGVGIFAS